MVTVCLVSVYSLIGVIYLKPVSAERTNCIKKQFYSTRGEERKRKVEIKDVKEKNAKRRGKRTGKWIRKERIAKEK